MTAWVMKTLGVGRDRADYLRQHYWATYGTTLAGLMREHDVDPAPYLTDVHDISMDSLTPDPELAHLIKSLPGRKMVYTNGCAPYAERVLDARGLRGVIDEIYGVEHANYLPKPEQGAFEMVFDRAGVIRTSAAMFEDDPRNLRVPHTMGLRTVLVGPTRPDDAYIQHHTDDLTGFLAGLTA